MNGNTKVLAGRNKIRRGEHPETVRFKSRIVSGCFLFDNALMKKETAFRIGVRKQKSSFENRDLKEFIVCDIVRKSRFISQIYSL